MEEKIQDFKAVNRYFCKFAEELLVKGVILNVIDSL